MLKACSEASVPAGRSDWQLSPSDAPGDVPTTKRPYMILSSSPSAALPPTIFFIICSSHTSLLIVLQVLPIQSRHVAFALAFPSLAFPTPDLPIANSSSLFWSQFKCQHLKEVVSLKLSGILLCSRIFWARSSDRATWGTMSLLHDVWRKLKD